MGTVQICTVLLVSAIVQKIKCHLRIFCVLCIKAKLIWGSTFSFINHLTHLKNGVSVWARHTDLIHNRNSPMHNWHWKHYFYENSDWLYVVFFNHQTEIYMVWLDGIKVEYAVTPLIWKWQTSYIIFSVCKIHCLPENSCHVQSQLNSTFYFK